MTNCWGFLAATSPLPLKRIGRNHVHRFPENVFDNAQNNDAEQVATGFIKATVSAPRAVIK
jgi:hypothetical protein